MAIYLPSKPVNMKISCPNCRRTILNYGIDLKRGYAECIYCDHTFDLSDHEISQLRRKPRDKFPKPKHIKIIESNLKQLKFGYRWFRIFSPILMTLGAFLFFATGFLVFDAGSVFINNVSQTPGFLSKLWAVFLGLSVIGVGLVTGGLWFFAGLSNSLNRTRVTADRTTLSIHHGIIPAMKNHQIKVEQLKQFYITQSIHKGKNGESYTYDLWVVLRNGKRQKLLTQDKASHAWYIEQELERFYDITDQAVDEEYATYD